MSRNTILTLVLGVIVVSLGGLTAACAGAGAEASIVRSFFQASRYNDRATLGNMAMVVFDPDEDGVASGISIESVGEEQVRALRLREFLSALEEARAAEEAFNGEKKVYQDEHFEAINRVLETERAGEAVAPRDEEVQTEWTTWRDQTMDHTKMISDARSALSDESLIAEVSANDPNNPIDVQQFEGELVTKEVVVSASVERDGSSEDRTMTITLQRVILQDADMPIEGRWIVTDVN